MIPLSTADAPDPRLLGGAISIGNFDGVHQGHARLIQRLRGVAERIGGPAVAVTFDPPPAAILRPGQVPPPLTTIARRDALLRRCGADAVVVIKTTADLLQQSPETFFRTLVQGTLQARGMVEGPNFFFGRNRAGNPHLLQRMCAQAGIECEIAEPTTLGERMISSTRIRDLLRQGDVVAANELLTAPYELCGVVVPGAGRGERLGFPTANLAEIATLVPAAGVYACWVSVDQQHPTSQLGGAYGAAVHIGPNPTFGENASKVEVHVLDFAGDLYRRSVQVQFVAPVRGVQRFDSAADLREQLHRDLQVVRRLLAATPRC